MYVCAGEGDKAAAEIVTILILCTFMCLRVYVCIVFQNMKSYIVEKLRVYVCVLAMSARL